MHKNNCSPIFKLGMYIRSSSCVPYNYSCFLFLSYGPLIVFQFLFCIIYFLVHAITRSEFSQDYVLGTRMSVPPFYFESNAQTVLANGGALVLFSGNCVHRHTPPHFFVLLMYIMILKRNLKNKTTTVKPAISGHSKRRLKLVMKTVYHLMQVKSIAECSKGSILQYFRPSLSNHLSLRSLFCLFLSGCLRQVLLYFLMNSNVIIM